MFYIMHSRLGNSGQHTRTCELQRCLDASETCKEFFSFGTGFFVMDLTVFER